MTIELVATHPTKPTMRITFTEDAQILYLEGTEPIVRKGLTIEDAEKILANAGYDNIKKNNKNY